MIKITGVKIAVAVFLYWCIIFWLTRVTPCSGEIREGEEMLKNIHFFQREIEPVYQTWIIGPGEHLSIFDNITDLKVCKERTGVNATVMGPIVQIIVDKNLNSLKHVKFDTSYLYHYRIPELLEEEKIYSGIFIGEFNNPFFSSYREFYKLHPEAFMLDKDNNFIKVDSIQILSVDDPTMMQATSKFIRDAVEIFEEHPYLKFWVIGGEESYPDYFALPVGDFRPASIKHFEEFLRLKRWDIPTNKELIFTKENNTTKAAWYLYREQAMVDRAAFYMQQFLKADRSRPIFYPTHGNPFAGDMRCKLGQSPSLLAGVVDGLEMGHITIDDDDEILNLLYLSNFTAFGTPTIAPRLGNKTLDSTAQGGGRSFTPVMLRRLVYECLGMGLWHIGPIHWTSRGADGEWALKDTPAEKEASIVFKEIKKASSLLTGMSRLQPRVGLYVSDATWVKCWNPLWTDFFQQAIANQWQITIVNDALLSAKLAEKMPILISIDNSYVSIETRKRLEEYLSAGGYLFVWGEFGVYDEIMRRDPIKVIGKKHRKGKVIKLDFPSESEKKELVNEFLTTNGAWKWCHEYSSVSLDKVEKEILKYFPISTLKPVEVETKEKTAPVNIYTLTDGTSLLTVVINRTDKLLKFHLEPMRELFTSGQDWCYYDIIAEKTILATKYYSEEMTLAPYGTSLVWIYPSVDEKLIDMEVKKALETMSRYKDRELDISFLHNIEKSLREDMQNDSLFPKTYCLARFILSSLCLKRNVTEYSDGSIDIWAEVYDCNGKPVSNAQVYVRLVPGVFKWLPLQENQRGKYKITLSQEDLPVFYDSKEQKYKPLSGSNYSLNRV